MIGYFIFNPHLGYPVSLFFFGSFVLISIYLVFLWKYLFNYITIIPCQTKQSKTRLSNDSNINLILLMWYWILTESGSHGSDQPCLICFPWALDYWKIAIYGSPINAYLGSDLPLTYLLSTILLLLSVGREFGKPSSDVTYFQKDDIDPISEMQSSFRMQMAPCPSLSAVMCIELPFLHILLMGSAITLTKYL